MPLGILLLGLAAIAGFMAFRPWPVGPTAQPIKPGTYAVEILRGQPPAASIPPDRQTEIGVIEGGLMVLAGVWVISKAAKVASSASGLLGGAGSILGKIFSGIKGIFTNPTADETAADDALSLAGE